MDDIHNLPLAIYEMEDVYSWENVNRLCPENLYARTNKIPYQIGWTRSVPSSQRHRGKKFHLEKYYLQVWSPKWNCHRQRATIHQLRIPRFLCRMEHKTYLCQATTTPIKWPSWIDEQNHCQYTQKRLEHAKGRWFDELPGVLWSYKTTTKTSTWATPFSLVYRSEAVVPIEIRISNAQSQFATEEQNNEMLKFKLERLMKSAKQQPLESPPINNK